MNEQEYDLIDDLTTYLRALKLGGVAVPDNIIAKLEEAALLLERYDLEERVGK